VESQEDAPFSPSTFRDSYARYIEKGQKSIARDSDK